MNQHSWKQRCFRRSLQTSDSQNAGQMDLSGLEARNSSCCGREDHLSTRTESRWEARAAWISSELLGLSGIQPIIEGQNKSTQEQAFKIKDINQAQHLTISRTRTKAGLEQDNLSIDKSRKTCFLSNKQHNACVSTLLPKNRCIASDQRTSTQWVSKSHTQQKQKQTLAQTQHRRP